MFGDHLGDVQGGPANWAQSLESCNTYVKKVKDAGGDAVMMYLPQMGIKGNSHMLMQDRNSLQLADLIVDWIDRHVEKKIGHECEDRRLAQCDRSRSDESLVRLARRHVCPRRPRYRRRVRRSRIRPRSSGTASPVTTSG